MFDIFVNYLDEDIEGMLFSSEKDKAHRNKKLRGEMIKIQKYLAKWNDGPKANHIKCEHTLKSMCLDF